MFSYIDELRKRPIEERRNVAKTFTFFIVGTIALLWLFLSLFPFGRLFPADETAHEKPAVQNPHGIVGPYE